MGKDGKILYTWRGDVDRQQTEHDPIPWIDKVSMAAWAAERRHLELAVGVDETSITCLKDGQGRRIHSLPQSLIQPPILPAELLAGTGCRLSSLDYDVSVIISVNY